MDHRIRCLDCRRHIHIPLAPELEDQVRQKVESGLYNNASEVINDALRFMFTREDFAELMNIDALRKMLTACEQQTLQGAFEEAT